MIATASLNGETITSLSLQSRAAQYGDGVFRTMLVHGGSIWLEAQQIATLIRDAKAIALNPPAAELIQQQLRKQAKALSYGVIKASLIALDTARGYARHTNDAQLLLQSSALPERFFNKLRTGARLYGLDFKLAANPRLSGIKHLNRLEQVLAKQLQPAQADEALVQHPAGGWLSGVMSNLFWFTDGLWHTPKIDQCGIDGVVRQAIIQELQGKVQYTQSASTQTLAEAESVVICNSLMGLWPVASWYTPELQTEKLWSHSQLASFSPLVELHMALKHPRFIDE